MAEKKTDAKASDSSASESSKGHKLKALVNVPGEMAGLEGGRIEAGDTFTVSTKKEADALRSEKYAEDA
jgi:hypothetical protein